MSIKEIKCASCGEIYNPSDSPYKGDLHLKKCEKWRNLNLWIKKGEEWVLKYQV